MPTWLSGDSNGFVSRFSNDIGGSSPSVGSMTNTNYFQTDQVTPVTVAPTVSWYSTNSTVLPVIDKIRLLIDIVSVATDLKLKSKAQKKLKQLIEYF